MSLERSIPQNPNILAKPFYKQFGFVLLVDSFIYYFLYVSTLKYQWQILLLFYQIYYKICLKMNSKPNLNYVYPPDLQKSQKHYFATKIFKGIQENGAGQQCQCCERKIGSKDISHDCTYSPAQLAFLGTGVPLFFVYLRNAIILLIILVTIFGIFGLYSNIKSRSCTDSSTCESNIFNTISIVNKVNQKDYLSIQNYMLLTFILINLVALQFFRRSFRITEEQCDKFFDTPSDYSIIIRRLPKNCTTNQIQQMIETRKQWLNSEQIAITQNLKVINIVLSYSLSEYKEIREKNDQNFKNYINKQDREDTFVFQPLPFPKETSSIAIVIFARQQSKDMFLYKPSILQRLLQFMCSPCIPLSEFQVNGQRVAIERAPEPDDIIWENAGISIMGSIFRKVWYSFLACILLLAGGAAQYGLAVAQNSMTSQNNKLIMGFASSIITVITNAIILQFIVFTTNRERSQTQTQVNTVLTVKISFFQFLNSGVFVVIANVLADLKGFNIQSGIASEVTQIMILNAISPNLSLFILNYFDLFGKIKRWLIKRETLKCSQMEANLAFEGPSPQIPYKYAFILKTLWLTAFYCPLVPIVIPISIIGLAINYFLQKLLYGGTYKAPNMISSMVNDSAVELLQYFGLILSLGQFVIYLYFYSFKVDMLPNYWSIPIYVSLALSIINLILPMQSLNKKIFKLKQDTNKYQDYQKVEQKFEVTYQMTNPAYQCKRKRKRDQFLWRSIFGIQNQGQKPIQLTNLFGLTSQKPLINPRENQQNLLKMMPMNPNLFRVQNKQQPTQQNQNYNGYKSITQSIKGNINPNQNNGANLNVPMYQPPINTTPINKLAPQFYNSFEDSSQKNAYNPNFHQPNSDSFQNNYGNSNMGKNPIENNNPISNFLPLPPINNGGNPNKYFVPENPFLPNPFSSREHPSFRNN